MEGLLKPPARFLLVESEAYGEIIKTIPCLSTVEEAQGYVDMLLVDIEAINEQIMFYKQTGLYPNQQEWNDAEHWLRSAGWKRYVSRVKIKIVDLSISRYLEGIGVCRSEVEKKLDSVAGKLGQQIGEERAKRGNAIEAIEKRLNKLAKWLKPYEGDDETEDADREVGLIYNKLNYLEQKLTEGFKVRLDEERRVWAAIKKEKKIRGSQKEHLDKRVLYLACLLMEVTGEGLAEIKKFLDKYPDWRAEIERRLEMDNEKEVNEDGE